MSLHGLPFVTPFIFSHGEKAGGGWGAGFDTCLYMALPLSLHSSSGKVKRGTALTCLYMAFLFVTPFIFSKGETGCGFNIGLYMACPLSFHSSSRKAKTVGGFNI